MIMNETRVLMRIRGEVLQVSSSFSYLSLHTNVLLLPHHFVMIIFRFDYFIIYFVYVFIYFELNFSIPFKLFLSQAVQCACAQTGETESLPICTPSTVVSLPDFVHC